MRNNYRKNQAIRRRFITKRYPYIVQSSLLLHELLIDADAVVRLLASQQPSLEDRAEILHVLVHGKLLLHHSVFKQLEEAWIHVGDGHRLVQVGKKGFSPGLLTRRVRRKSLFFSASMVTPFRRSKFAERFVAFQY